ncbi:hypothetical protein V5F77_20905 [Xanthobacter sp. DSM 24535]|uniref:hypothetical protein n=1 Tax=Roseixanthobacter psychrophilus TaxID=3119917 RepID=UPI00372C1FC3
MQNAQRQTLRHVLDFAVFAAILVLLLGVIRPFTFAFPTDGLDPSWTAVLGEASALGLRSGVDVLFTGGPFSTFYSQYFQADSAPAVIIARIAWVAYFLTYFAVFWQGRTFLARVLLVPFFAVCVLTHDGLILVTPVLAAWAVLEQPERRAAWIFGYAGIAFCALLVLAKFLVFPLAVAAALVLDILSLRRRRPPLALVTFFALQWVLFWLSGQQASDFPAFISTSLEVAAGFGEAMSLFGDRNELASWLVMAVIVFVAVAWFARLRVNADRAAFWVEGLRVLFVLAVLLICFKAGFVRHDGHSFHAWAGLAVLSLLVAGSVAPAGRIAFASAVLVTGVIVGLGLAATRPVVHEPAWAQAAGRLKDGVAQFGPGLDFQLAQTRFFAERAAIKQQVLAQLRAAHPLPPLEGTVDVIPNLQTRVLANGLKYQPRPTIQEYTTYTPTLIQNNRAFFEGPRAPDNLLFGLAPIDERLPALSEGALWPLFLARYEPVQALPDLVVLRKRAVPLPDLLTPIGQETVRLREKVPLPATTQPIFVTMNIRPTLLGRVMNLVFRTPPVFLELDMADGSARRFRLIPGMARDGFLISPLVTRTDDFLRLAAGGDATLAGPQPVSFRIVTSGLGTRSYEAEVPVTFYRLQMPADAISAQTRALAAAAAR